MDGRCKPQEAIRWQWQCLLCRVGCSPSCQEPISRPDSCLWKFSEAGPRLVNVFPRGRREYIPVGFERAIHGAHDPW